MHASNEMAREIGLASLLIANVKGGCGRRADEGTLVKCRLFVLIQLYTVPISFPLRYLSINMESISLNIVQFQNTLYEV